MPQMPQDPMTSPDMGGPPMGPPPGPPPGPPAEGMPEDSKFDDMAAMAPMPDSTYSVQAIKTLVSQFNSTLEALAGGELPDVEWKPEEKGSKWQQPLPGEIFIPLMALDEALGILAGPDMAKKYELNPTEIKTDADLRKVSATLRSMEKDKKLAKVMQAPQEGPATGAGGPPPAPQAGEDEETDEQALKQSLA